MYLCLYCMLVDYKTHLYYYYYYLNLDNSLNSNMHVCKLMLYVQVCERPTAANTQHLGCEPLSRRVMIA